ncbi:unnamed protein product [Withania somnifera]
MIKKLIQGMADQKKALAAAKTDEEKDAIISFTFSFTLPPLRHKSRMLPWNFRACNNILAMTPPLHTKTPKFIGDQKINLSWKEVKPSGPPTATVACQKRLAATTNGSNTNPLVNKAFSGIYDGGRSSGRGGSRSWRGRGRGRSYH